MLSFHVKFVQTDRRTDGRTDRQRQTNYAPPPPDLSIREHKNISNNRKAESGEQDETALIFWLADLDLHPEK